MTTVSAKTAVNLPGSKAGCRTRERRLGSVPEKPGLAWAIGLVTLTGFASLVLQVAWFREFALFFGGSTAASAAVLAAFMGGLGIGNALLGSRVDRHPDPLRFFARLALSIALAGAASGTLIDVSRHLYIGLGGQTGLGFGGATAVRLLLATGVLALPTILMGGTLPAAARAVTTGADRERNGVALLYGFNTLGAVIGALAATFLLLATLGTRTTLWSASGTYALAAIAAYRMARSNLRPYAAQEKRKASEECQMQPASITLVYFAAGITGFTFFLMELVWYRMLGPILGGTTYTFGLILTIALLGIGMGGAVYPVIMRRLRVSLGVLAVSCGLQALGMAVPLALGDRIALWAAELYNPAAGLAVATAGWSFIAAIVVFPAAAIAGFQFPLLIALAGSGDDEIGSHVGRTFAANTVGAIFGSLAGGFGLLPWLTAPGAWRVAVFLLAGLAEGEV